MSQMVSEPVMARSGCGLWTPDCGLRTVDSGLWTPDSGLWTPDCGLFSYWFPPVVITTSV
jgi:hypothetical protein